MISEFRDLKDAVKFASLSIEALSPGYFVKVGKRVESGVVVFWVMVPIENDAADVAERLESHRGGVDRDGDR